MTDNNMKIGVYICHCGSNIAGNVDVEKSRKDIENVPNVKVARDYKFMCSEPGQDLIINDIKEKGLNRIVVASCSPLMHEPTFRMACEKAGVNRYLFQMVNIREQCSYVHQDPEVREEATEKAIELVKAGIGRSRLLEDIPTKKVSVKPEALVIGGGIGGINAALDLANQGYKVYLIEKETTIGGRMAQLDRTFPTDDCSI